MLLPSLVLPPGFSTSPPSQPDLKNATPLQPQDLQPGDRVLVRGPPLSDAHTIAALAVIVMKQGDISAKQQRERDDWQNVA